MIRPIPERIAPIRTRDELVAMRARYVEMRRKHRDGGDHLAEFAAALVVGALSYALGETSSPSERVKV